MSRRAWRRSRCWATSSPGDTWNDEDETPDAWTELLAAAEAFGAEVVPVGGGLAALQLDESARMLEGQTSVGADSARRLANERRQAMDAGALRVLDDWPELREAYSGEAHSTTVRGRTITNALRVTTMSGTSAAGSFAQAVPKGGAFEPFPSALAPAAD